MTPLLEVFAGLEVILTLVCLLAFLWGVRRNWEMELFAPLMFWMGGTIFLVIALLVSVVVHDHVHVHF